MTKELVASKGIWSTLRINSSNLIYLMTVWLYPHDYKLQMGYHQPCKFSLCQLLMAGQLQMAIYQQNKSLLPTCSFQTVFTFFERM